MRNSTFLPALLLLTVFGFVAVGCDKSPTSVEDFNVQPNVEISKSSLSLTLTSAQSTTSFQVSYQGLESVPTAKGTGILTMKKKSTSGSPKNGKQVWSVGADGSVSGITEETVVVRSQTGKREIVDSLTVRVSPFTVTSQFSAGFATIADYEDAQRDSSTTGGTSFTLQTNSNNNNDPVGSNGISYLEIDATASGAAVFERRASAPNSDRFTFLVRPSPNTDFNLTLTFTEETGGGTTDHQITVPVNAGSQWLKYGIVFSQIGADFNPVAQRAGGNGPLTKVKFSADADVTYAVDELMLGTANATQVEIMDFERTTGAYGPPFCPPSFSNSNDVATNSDGFTSRSVEGNGCFGYNYGGGLGPPANLFLDVEASDVLSVRVKASQGDSLEMFVETIDDNGDGTNDGGYNTGNSETVALPVGQWGTVEVRLDSLGNDPAALKSPGIRNVGFTMRGNNPDILIDDIKIKEPSGN
ncbi:MAG: hypothetical protein ABEL51_13735 [Salinibacter sp.]